MVPASPPKGGPHRPVVDTPGRIGRLATNVLIDLFEQLERQPAFRRARLQSLTEKFLGMNAVRWLGLRRGEGTRDRLDRFYSKHGLPAPDWAQKVDRERT